MDPHRFVFRDQHGTRWPRIRRGLLAAVLILLAGLALFAHSLLVKPRLAPLPTGIATDLTGAAAPPEIASRPKAPADWLTRGAVNPASAARPPLALARLGFLDDDAERALDSLRDHIGELTHLAPDWLRLTGMPPSLQQVVDPELAAFVAGQPVRLMPLLTNLVGETFDPEAVEHYLRASAETQRDFARQLRDVLREAGAAGVTIAWEQIDPAYRADLTVFVGRIRDTLRADGLELWLCIPMGDDIAVFDLDALAAHVDRFVAMLYYETGERDEAGPLASLGWFREWLTVLARHGRPEQWIASLATFGYDWPSAGQAELVAFQDAMARAVAARIARIEHGAPYDGPGFAYREAGVEHRVWFQDAVTFRNQQRIALEQGLGGVAIDRLGTEDPLVWRALQCGRACAPEEFARLAPGEAIGLVGQGDFLHAAAERAPGERQIQVDRDGVWGETYRALPHAPSVTREDSADARQVALTFDDGPDPHWTPRILDILRERRAPATFFVTGDHALAHPELIQRILDEGHTLGNHSFSHADLAAGGPIRARFELNATQRALEHLTGRSVLLFRPPYDADRRPHRASQLEPLLIAQELGYLPVMASIDPLDWQQPDADLLLERVREQRAAGGNVILLHDAGGDRSATLEALPAIVAQLRARGDRIVPLHEMLGLARDAVLPAIPHQDPAAERFLAGSGLRMMETARAWAWTFLMVSTALLLLRTLLVAGIALWRARAERRADRDASPDFGPPVSAIVAAYNESAVIVQTLTALLASRYSGDLEVVVVDDGSRDDTAVRVAALAARDGRVRLIRQDNAGKAAALRAGLAAARHGFVVMLDADTQFEPETLTELLRPLRDPRVGAVSARIDVGNFDRLLGRFQRIEYLMGFNLDRRAHDALDAITVIPGAASAYRAAAIRAAGGIQSDTLAEDTDLTLALHRAGYRIRHAPRAHALTEAPATVRAFFRQRRRWSFGTLQCLWKHRALTFNPAHGWLGLFALPGAWFFHILLAALVPFVDVAVLLQLLRGETGPLLVYALLFLAFDLTLAATACRLDGEPLRSAWLVLPMRLLYRPLLSLAILAAIHRALRGRWVAWGFQERWGSVLRRRLHRPWTSDHSHSVSRS